MKKNSEWSKLIELFSVVNVSSDMVRVLFASLLPIFYSTLEDLGHKSFPKKVLVLSILSQNYTWTQILARESF